MRLPTVIALALVPLICLSSSAQTPTDTTYKVELTATASPMVNFFRYPKAPSLTSRASLGYGLTIRGMWHPGRLLSIGVLTGYHLLSSDDITIARSSGHLHYTAELAAVPLQLAVSMQSKRVEVGVGVGPYLMLSAISGGGSASARGSRLEIGMTFFGSYLFSLTDILKIGPELRILYFRYRGIVSIMPSCSVRIDLVRY